MITYNVRMVDRDGCLEPMACELSSTPQTPFEFCNLLAQWADEHHRNTVYYCFMTSLNHFEVIFARDLTGAIVAMNAIGVPDFSMVDLIQKARLYFANVDWYKQQAWMAKLKQVLGMYRSEIAAAERILDVMPSNLRSASEALVNLLDDLENNNHIHVKDVLRRYDT